MSKINSQTVWVTGASSGIGEALVYVLNNKGCNLIISSRKEADLHKVKSNCSTPDRVAILPLDLNEYKTMPAKVALATAFFGSIDILVNNAGVSQRSLIIDTDIEVYKKLMDINYLGTVALSNAILPHFIANKKGRYVTVTSLVGVFGSPFRSGYSAAKHALHGFFDVLRMEHEKDGVAVTLICPGFINTNVAKNALTANGSRQKTNDTATQNGLSPEICAKQIIKAIEKSKFEAFIGGKETMGVYVKRFFPRWFHNLAIRSTVR